MPCAPWARATAMSSGAEAADGIERQRDVLAQRGEAIPADAGRTRMRRRRPRPDPSTAKSQPSPFGPTQFVGVVAGRCHRQILRPMAARASARSCAARRCTPMPSSRASATSPLTSTSAPADAAARDGGADQRAPARWLDRRRSAQLHAAHAGVERALKRRQPGCVVIARRGRDQVAIGLQQRRDHRAVRGRHRVAGQLVRRHPGQRLAFVALRACRATPRSGARPAAGACADTAAAPRSAARRCRRRCRVLRAVRAPARLPAIRPVRACRRGIPTGRRGRGLRCDAPAGCGRGRPEDAGDDVDDRCAVTLEFG